MITLFIYVIVVKSSDKLLNYLMFDLNINGSENGKFTNLSASILGAISCIIVYFVDCRCSRKRRMIDKFNDLTRFNKIAISNNKFQMASGQGSQWLIESPTIFSSMCSPPLSDICQFYF